ncbi:MAG TPA: GNAT family N-acetyltransferase [Actinomycetota bacterium]|nr:GNAT family N-acetyltransferase [Actinomycetota bacterium]
MIRSFPFTTRDGRPGVVRQAVPRDARAALALTRATMLERPRTLGVTEEDFWTVRQWRRHRMVWGDRGASIVADLSREVVGVLTVHRGGRPSIRHSAEVGIVVAERARGIGVGSALMRAAEVWAFEHGVTRLALGVFRGNERAHRLYVAMGYEEEGMEVAGVRFPEGDVDVIRMYRFVRGDPARRPGQSDRPNEYDARINPTREEHDG